MAAPMLTSLFLGFMLRLYLFRFSAAEWFADQVEVSTPITSWRRVTEGLALLQNGVSPYAGDIFHETPLMLRFLHFIMKRCPMFIDLVFVAADMLTALILERSTYYISLYLLLQQDRRKRSFAKDTEKIQIDLEELQWRRLHVVIAYLFNPYTIATCISKSTAVFNNLALAGALFFTVRAPANRRAATYCLAVASYQSLYPAMLVVPMAMCLAQNDLTFKVKWSSFRAIFSITKTIAWFTSWVAFLLLLSVWYEKSWAFVGSTYGFIISVPDLTPNIGVFWYFFTEMFEHFRLFFICVFQINAFIYTVPLAIKLKDHPLFMLYIQLGLIAVFKSYPSYADTVLYLALLPVWYFTFPYLRNSFVVGCMFLSCSVLAPILYHLWIYAGSANANFYFAITLVFSAAQIFLITDVLFAFLRREYDLMHGTKPKEFNGKPGQILLE